MWSGLHQWACSLRKSGNSRFLKTKRDVPIQVSESNYFLTRVLISRYLTCWSWKFNLPWSFTILIIKPWAWSSAFFPLVERDKILFILCQKTLELPWWWRLCAPNAGAPSSIPSQGTRLYMLQLCVGMPQLKILHVARKTRCSQIGKKNNNNLACILHLKWVINPWPLSFSNVLLTHSKSHLIALVWQSLLYKCLRCCPWQGISFHWILSCFTTCESSNCMLQHSRG